MQCTVHEAHESKKNRKQTLYLFIIIFTTLNDFAKYDTTEHISAVLKKLFH